MKLIYALLLLVGVGAAGAELSLPAIISDHAVFQTDAPIRIWGWARPGERVSVVLQASGGASLGAFATDADPTGAWHGELPKCASGQRAALSVTGDHGDKLRVEDIICGEVWLGGGQSNMDYDIAGDGRVELSDPAEVTEVAANVVRAKQEAATAAPAIRYFKALYSRSAEPAADVAGKWMLVSPDTVARCSAVAWNFGVALHSRLQVPIGLVVSSVGNTPIEAWMAEETLRSTSAGRAVLERNRRALAAASPAALEAYRLAAAKWNAANPTPATQYANRRSRPQPPYSDETPAVPARFYNAMIRGLQPFALKGILWFQGDSNADHPQEYSELFIALIREWRHEWLGDQLPFYFVELNNMREDVQTRPVQPNNVSLIREQQHAALSLPAVAMVCSIDVGTRNPHFPRKKPVGERLAAVALQHCYGQPIIADGPCYSAYEIQADKVRLRFTGGNGLQTHDGGALRGFAVRAESGEWTWALGSIDGDEIVVWSPTILHPAAVRYAWAMNPVWSVINGAGLPLAPFRTDISSLQ